MFINPLKDLHKRSDFIDTHIHQRMECCQLIEALSAEWIRAIKDGYDVHIKGTKDPNTGISFVSVEVRPNSLHQPGCNQ